MSESREVDISVQKPPQRLTVMSYGPSGTGKTEFASTAPYPRFISDQSEQGWDTIQTVVNFKREKLYDQSFIPQVRRVKTLQDIYEEIDLADKDFKAGKIFSVVFDSLTFIANAIQAQLTRILTSGGKAMDNRQLYDLLKTKLREIMLRAHDIGDAKANVFWLALSKEPADEGKDGGILIPGQQANMAPAACSLWLYQLNYVAGKEQVFETRTKKFGCYPARGRFGDVLPDPLPESSFRCIEQHLGMTPVSIATSSTQPKPLRRIAR